MTKLQQADMQRFWPQASNLAAGQLHPCPNMDRRNHGCQPSICSPWHGTRQVSQLLQRSADVLTAQHAAVQCCAQSQHVLTVLASLPVLDRMIAHLLQREDGSQAS